MNTYYAVLSTLCLAFMATIWSKSGWVNFSIKFCFFVMAIFGVVVTAAQFGYLVKV
jgi:hypothetical protein